jgi:hypothetical protein
MVPGIMRFSVSGTVGNSSTSSSKHVCIGGMFRLSRESSAGESIVREVKMAKS